MQENVRKRVIEWKKIFSQKSNGVDENSSWTEILLSLNSNPKELAKLISEAMIQCGVFTTQEQNFLNSLPGRDEILAFCRTLHYWDIGNSFCLDLKDGDKAYFLRYPRAEDGYTNNLTLDITIVTSKEPKIDFDTFTFISGPFTFNNVILRYGNEPPKKWLKERAKDERPSKAKGKNCFAKGNVKYEKLIIDSDDIDDIPF